jgi:hypothetical protein
MGSEAQLRAFRWRRRVGLWLGIFVPGCCFFIAVVNYRLGLLSSGMALVDVALGLGLGAYCSSIYRCPFCGRCPEEDIPNFDPATCCKCGASLR